MDGTKEFLDSKCQNEESFFECKNARMQEYLDTGKKKCKCIPHHLRTSQQTVSLSVIHAWRCFWHPKLNIPIFKIRLWALIPRPVCLSVCLSVLQNLQKITKLRKTLQNLRKCWNMDPLTLPFLDGVVISFGSPCLLLTWKIGNRTQKRHHET